MLWIALAPLMLLVSGCSRSTPGHPALSGATSESTRVSPLPASTPTSPRTALSPTQLLELLPSPTALPEVKDAPPPSTGRQVFGDGNEIFRASREFRFRNGGYLVVQVSDYASAPTHLQKEAQLIRTPGKDYESQLLEFLSPPDGFGYVLWDPISRNGRLRALRAGRFLFEAEGGDLPPQIAWSRLLDYFPPIRAGEVSQPSP
ncbi:hypothetical protein HRbin21_00448 [bacterium HR21]|nr:hypothetical protein HRbin21_00448 [bacterium HR21]